MIHPTPPQATTLPAHSTAHAQSISQSHARCQAMGVEENRLPDLSPVSPGTLREMRERNRRLFEHAAPVMELLFEQIVSTRSLVVLTDHHGTILHSVGDDGFMERAQQVALAPGVNWSEATKGTNAVGTALFDEAATLVHGSEHFVRANRFLTCSASPIFDHAGKLLGVLDVSGDQRSYHPHTLAMVTMSARMIENQWFTDRFRHGVRLHFHHRAEYLGTMREGMVALSPEGQILGANRSALDQLRMSPAALRIRGLEAVFGVSLAHIVDHCRRHSDEPLHLPPANGDVSGPPLYARAYFNWPTLWPATAPVAAPHAAPGVAAPETPAPGAKLEDVELAAIRRAVDAAGGNISKAARQLGIGRNTVYRKLRARS